MVISLDPIKARINPDNREAAVKNWELIVNACASNSIDDDGNLAAICATVTVETGCTFCPVEERGSDAYFVRMYWDKIFVRRSLGNQRLQDAINYHGRGYIQITGLYNYAKASQALDLNLVSNPVLALHPDVAAKILIWFWQTKKLDLLCRELEKIQLDSQKIVIFQEVRKRVNGGLSGLTLYMDVLRDLGAI
jgi:hypothetical protein